MKIKALIVAALVLTANAPAAVAPFFKVGVGDQVKVNFSPYNLLSTYMAPGQDNVMGNFQTHWFHAGWKTHFPVAIAGGACATGLEWSSLADYQSVLNAGKILVFVWWWHNDMPCDASIRADAEATATGCLKPLLQSLTNGEVWVVFEPEYNVSTGSAAGTGGACGGMRIHRDPTWGTHINNMILQAKAGAHAGLTVKAGPAIGGFGYDENVYTLEPSLENCYANSDFIAYHHITRNDTYTSDPWAAPDPEAVKFSLSLSRYLSRRFNKPLFYAYWSSRNGLAGQGQQDADLKSHFANRAEFEADGVQGFGPYWYFDNGYPGEGLKSAPLSPYSVFNTWKAEANAIMTGTNGTHSIGFVSPDHGDIFDAPGPLNVQWISRGRPATNSTYSTAYRINGGADQAFPNGYSSGGFPDSTGFSAPLSLCTIAPSCNVQVKAAADDATFAYSRRFTVRNPNYTSNANDKFDITLNGWSGANAWFSGGGKFTAALSSAQWFHGGSSMELSGAFTAATQKWAVGTNTSVVIPSGSPATLNFKMYIPFDLNPTVDMGSAVTFLNYQIRMNSVLYDNYSGPLIPLEMGWNDVTITITGGTAGGTVDHVDLVVFNKWGQAGDAFFSVGANPKIYVDELHYGGPCAFTPLGGGCASPTNTPLVTATFTPTRTDSPQPGSPTPSPTNSPIATFTPTPAAACAADWNFDDGTLQNWVVDSGPAAGLASLTTLPHDGSNSMRASLALAQSAGSTQVLLKNTTGFPRDYTGQTLHYWLYIPAGFSDVSNPSGATLYVKTTAAFTWNESTWMNLPSTAGWVEITFNVSAIANISDVREVGLKIALGGTSPSPPASTVYIDSVGRMSGACASPTPTPTPTRTPAAPTFTFTPTPTASPTRTLSPTPSMTSTRSASPTPSITLTYSLTPTTSSSMTSTPVVNTATFTPTPTPSPTQTMSFSATASPTFSDTRTATVSFTPSDSPSPTRTLSFTQSATPTLTGTPLPGSPTNTMSFTPTYSITLTATPTPSPSSSATPTLTATETASFTDSPTPTQSPTVSPTFSDSPTPLPGSPTNTPTFTATPSHSPTLSWTPSFTKTSTPTPSASPSTTQSFTPSQTPLGSFTATPTRTASPTPTKTPLVSPNPTPDYGQVLETLPVFNPQDGAGTVFIAARLNGRADGFELRIYSKAYNLIGKGELSGSFLNGWHSLAFVMPELANGLWFYQIRAVNAGKKSGLPRTGKILILK